MLRKYKGDGLDKDLQEEIDNSSELEEFKISSGGAATTSFHMTRKNSTAKISDLVNSDDTVNQREILNLLHTLLSINIKGEESKLSEEAIDCKKILTDKEVQSNLGKFSTTYLDNFVNLQCGSGSIGYTSAIVTRKHKVVEILSKIVSLLEPEILSKSLDPNTISRQMRAFMMSHSSNPIMSELDFRPGVVNQEEAYILSILCIIQALLQKDKSHISVPMIREGIFDMIKEMYEACPDSKSLLPSFDYIESRLSPVKKQTSKSQETGQEGHKKLQKPRDYKQRIIELVTSIKKSLESCRYTHSTLIELKRISKVLKRPESSSQLCREALSRFTNLLAKDGITYYEVTQSKIIESLHSFLIDTDENYNNEKSLWTRIEMFESGLNLQKNTQ